MASCAFEGCGDPRCDVCTVYDRFPGTREREEMQRSLSEHKKGAPALNGQKPRPTRDPSKIQRRRKPL
jgi:hypothetical protein